MDIAKNLKYFFILPAVLSVAAILAIVLWGLKPGIDLSGGSIMQVSYQQERPAIEVVRETASHLGFGEVRTQPTGEHGVILRQRELTNDERAALESALASLGPIEKEATQFNSIGPAIGAELLQKAWIAITLVVVLTILFIAFAFRGVSKPIQSWKYGVVAIATLLHDILIPMGLFALLGHLVGAEVDALFIVALLTILGHFNQRHYCRI